MQSQTVARKLDYSDIERTPEDDGLRYEVLDGVLFVSPAPRPVHQRVSKRLQRQLENYFEDKGLGEVFNAPVDVLLARHDIAVPDLVLVTQPKLITERAIEGAPTLLVEVLSLSSRSRDRRLKMSRYAASGVPHYWIVDPVKQTIECYRLKGKHYTLVTSAKSPEKLTHPDWDGLTIDLDAIWK